MWHHVPVLKAGMGFGQKLQKWDACDESLKSFAHMAVASLVGCTWCLDFNYFMAHNEGLDVEPRRGRCRGGASPTSSRRSSGEVMEYAEAMTPDAARRSPTRWSASLLEQLGAGRARRADRR